MCVRYGEDHPTCLVFHHRGRRAKEIEISEAMRRTWGRKRVLAELAKCDVLCANCHMRLHAQEGRDGVDA